MLVIIYIGATDLSSATVNFIDLYKSHSKK